MARASLLLVALAVPGSEMLKFVTGSLQLIALGWLGLRLALFAAPRPPRPSATWRRVLAALLLTAFYIPAAPLAAVVVASDGVGSALRQQLISDTKRYLGLTCIVGQAPIAVQHPLLDGGFFIMLGDSGSSVFCYRDQSGFHLSNTEYAPAESDLASLSAEALLRRVQTATAKWSAPVPQIAAALNPSTLVVRGYYDKEPLKRVRDGRVWLLGDAAHPMSPFQGQGANMAMLDALKLAELLGGSMPSEQAVGALEADIVTRGHKAVLESRNAAKQFHEQSRFKQRNRNLGFRMVNVGIKLFSRGSRRPRPVTA